MEEQRTEAQSANSEPALCRSAPARWHLTTQQRLAVMGLIIRSAYVRTTAYPHTARPIVAAFALDVLFPIPAVGARFLEPTTAPTEPPAYTRMVHVSVR